MSNYLTDAISVKSYDLSEADKIVVMYSKDKGIIRCVAKGAKKLKCKIGGCTDLLIANKIMLYKGKSLDRICQAQAINSFNNIRTDMNKMLFSMYISEIVTQFGTENDPNSEQIYDLFYKALAKISSSKTQEEIMLAVMRFQLKIMQICGYALQLDTCVRCGCGVLGENIGISVSKGGVVCVSCAEGDAFGLHFKLREFLCALLDSEFDSDTVYDKKANEKVCAVCFKLLKKYVETHCSKPFKTTKMLPV